MGLPFNLEDEEERKLKAINDYNNEYKKIEKYYCKCYIKEVKRTVIKSKFITMLRDKEKIMKE